MDASGKHELLIVIPAHNEEKNLPQVIDNMRNAGVFDYADCLVVDDASQDGTYDLIKSSGVMCISFIYNLGYGNALQAGYRFATERNYQYIIQMDADGQHDVCNIPAIYEALRSEEAPDVVLGSRFIKGSAEYKPGILKTVGFKYFEFVNQVMGGGHIKDVTTGLQGLSRAAFSYYACFDNFDSKFPDANMILQMKLLGFRVVQIPAVMHMRTEGVGMHSGLIKPAKYMIRSSIALLTVWLRIRVLKIKN